MQHQGKITSPKGPLWSRGHTSFLKNWFRKGECVQPQPWRRGEARFFSFPWLTGYGCKPPLEREKERSRKRETEREGERERERGTAVGSDTFNLSATFFFAGDFFVTPFSTLIGWLAAAAGTGVTTEVQGSGFRVQGSGFRVQGSGFGVQGSGFRVQGSGFRGLQDPPAAPGSPPLQSKTQR